MSFIARGPKKPVNMTLSEDLVREARSLTHNLSETVERLLADYIAAEQAKRAEKERRIDATILALNEHEKKYGVWGEEYSTL